MGHKWLADNSKGVEKLGLTYRSLKMSTEEMFQQMIDQVDFNKNEYLLLLTK